MDARSIARPYAKAAFEYACQNQQLANWSVALSILAKVTADEKVIALLKNPQVDSKKLSNMMIEAMNQGFLDDTLKNLLGLLAVKQRLILLPEIFQLFEEYRSAYEKTVQAEIISAWPVSIEQQDKLATALKIRLQRNVMINNEIDPTLLGGAMIKVGDLVIDDSAKNTFSKLLNYLSAP